LVTIILVLIILFGGGGGCLGNLFGGGRNNCGCGGYGAEQAIEKQNIITAAETNYRVIEEDNYGRITKLTNIYPEDTGNAYEITYSYNGKSITTISTQKSPAYTIRTEGTVTYK
jgi:hypothetical protein